MPRPPSKGERYAEDPMVAEVRKAREELLAAAGYDLEELCRRLREQQQRREHASVARQTQDRGRQADTGPTRPDVRAQPAPSNTRRGLYFASRPARTTSSRSTSSRG